MKRVFKLGVAAAAAAASLALAVPASAAPRASSTVCQPNGTGCTKGGTYYVYSRIYHSASLDVTWTGAKVDNYTSGVPLWWTATVTYHNNGNTILYFSCPGDWTNPGYSKEWLRGGSGNTNGYVGASVTTCSANPDFAATLGPGREFTVTARFHNVPWPGTSVAIQWGSYGTSPYVRVFG